MSLTQLRVNITRKLTPRLAALDKAYGAPRDSIFVHTNTIDSGQLIEIINHVVMIGT
jgi:hypothetical protein